MGGAGRWVGVERASRLGGKIGGLPGDGRAGVTCRSDQGMGGRCNPGAVAGVQQVWLVGVGGEG